MTFTTDFRDDATKAFHAKMDAMEKPVITALTAKFQSNTNHTMNKNRQGLSPAALCAALAGNAGNFIAATTPGGIEAQEKAGQLEQAKRETLPLELGQRRRMTIEEARKPWESLGFAFGGPVDGIFAEAKFPEGWKKQPTDHAMWSDIVDGQGRVRGNIFYKAAFYDRRAHAHLSPRFGIGNDYAAPLATISVRDACGEVDFKISGLEQPDWSGDRQEADRRQAKQDAAREACVEFLRKNYPAFEDPCAYWI